MRLILGIGILVVVGVVIAVGILASNSIQSEDENVVFHITLADSKQYKDGIYSHIFQAEKGVYFFRFVPNGDSPELLGITLNGENFHFFENFILKGTLHESGISEFFTWEYEGKSKVEFIDDMELEIIIDPYENLMGPVSVELIMI
jgi:hypothetical protein